MDEGSGSGWWPKGSDPEKSGEGGERPEQGDPQGREGTGGGRRPPRPPRGLQSRDRPKVASRYSLYVGLAFVILAGVAVYNAVRTDEGGLFGADPDANRGLPIPEFAAPDALASLGRDFDANIAQDDCDSSRNPCPADQVRVPACEVEAEGAIRVCDFFDKPLAISFWFTRGGDCLPSQDAFARVAAERSDELNFLSVNILDDRDDVARIVREHGWEVPVAHDTDGAVSNIIGVGVCPTILLAYPGGIIESAQIREGNYGAAEIDALVADLLAASEARERGA